MQLVIDAEERHRRGGHPQQNAVDRKGHHTADGLHHDGGQTDPINVGHILPQKAIALQTDVNDRVLDPVEPQRSGRTNELTDDGGDSSAPDAHGRTAQQAENHDGVKDDVHHSTDDERNHRQHRITHGLQKPLAVGLQKDAPAEHEVHRKIFPAKLLQFRVVRQCGGDLIGKQQPHQCKHQRGSQHQKQAGGGGTAGFLRLFLPQLAGEQSVQTNGSAHADGDHQKLDGIHKGSGGQGSFGQPCHKDTVHNIVQRLDEQRQHQRHGHRVQQGRMGISASLFFEFIRPPFSGKQKSAKSLRSSNSSGFHALSVGFLYLVRNVL